MTDQLQAIRSSINYRKWNAKAPLIVAFKLNDIVQNSLMQKWKQKLKLQQKLDPFKRCVGLIFCCATNLRAWRVYHPICGTLIQIKELAAFLANADLDTKRYVIWKGQQ